MPEASASYDHSRKAGNRADVWKHAMLLEVLGRIASDPDRRGPFHYVETHAGQAWHTLAPGGEWESGIGRISPRGALASSRYFRTLSRLRKRAETYPASWLMAADVLRETAAAFRLSLYDTGAHVQADMERRHELLQDLNATFASSDGYAAAANLQPPAFVFIDPPYTPERDADALRAVDAVAALAARDVACAVWYPVFGAWNGLRTEDLPGSMRFECVWGSDRSPGDDPMIGSGMAFWCATDFSDRSRPAVARAAERIGRQMGGADISVATLR